jgi:FkbM family methyltransferase
MNSITKYKLITQGIVSERLKFLLNTIDLDNAKTILDIGSWHLEQAIELSTIFNSSKIYAFEPVPESYVNCLERSKYFKNISVFNLAVTDFCGETSFYPVDPKTSPNPNIGASSLLKFKDGLNGSFFNQCWIQKEIKVEASTLDSWSEKNNINSIDIIWIDVQGAELQVFKGADKILEKTKVILTEVGLKPYYENHSMKNEIDTYLFSKGFIEIKEAFEFNGSEYEGNAIYINSKI